MKAYISEYDLRNGFVRTHPWADSKDFLADKYYDFKANPELIAQVLNEFKGWADWSRWEGVQLFYKLLEWLNGPDSQFESSGCGFRGPSANRQKERWPGKLISDGGLVFLFRDLELNLSDESAAWAKRFMSVGGSRPPLAAGKNVSWLLRQSRDYLQQLSPEFDGGCVSIVLFPTIFVELPLEDKDKLGHEICFQWWAWGETERETMNNFKEVVAIMFECLKRINEKNSDK